MYCAAGKWSEVVDNAIKAGINDDRKVEEEKKTRKCKEPTIKET